jgi:hypothetical protein
MTFMKLSEARGQQGHYTVLSSGVVIWVVMMPILQGCAGFFLLPNHRTIQTSRGATHLTTAGV